MWTGYHIVRSFHHLRIYSATSVQLLKWTQHLHFNIEHCLTACLIKECNLPVLEPNGPLSCCNVKNAAPPALCEPGGSGACEPQACLYQASNSPPSSQTAEACDHALRRNKLNDPRLKHTGRMPRASLVTWMLIPIYCLTSGFVLEQQPFPARNMRLCWL